MSIKSIAALGLIAAVVIPGITSAHLNTSVSGPYASSEVTPVSTLSLGEGSFTKKGQETEVLSFTATERVGGYGLESYRTRPETVTIMVDWSDGYKTFYNFFDDGRVAIGDHNIKTGTNWTGAEIKWDGSTAVITSENGAITELGGIKPLYNRLSASADEAIQATKERDLIIQNETFDMMISRLSHKVCARVESFDYISERTIINNGLNEIIPTFEMSSSNQTRWNNMNGRLRAKHVMGAMNYDCNNVMMTSFENWRF